MGSFIVMPGDRTHSHPRTMVRQHCQPNAERKEGISNLQFQEDQGDQCHLFHPTNEI